MVLVYDKELIGYINTFENIAKIKVKDCYKSDDFLTFIVEPVYMTRAIGKNGSNVKRLSSLLRKKIRVVEFNNDVIAFVKNLIMNVDSKIYKEDEGVVAIKITNNKEKGIVIGRDKKNINNLQNIVSRYFSVKLKVV